MLAVSSKVTFETKRAEKRKLNELVTRMRTGRYYFVCLCMSDLFAHKFEFAAQWESFPKSLSLTYHPHKCFLEEASLEAVRFPIRKEALYSILRATLDFPCFKSIHNCERANTLPYIVEWLRASENRDLWPTTDALGISLTDVFLGKLQSVTFTFRKEILCSILRATLDSPCFKSIHNCERASTLPYYWVVASFRELWSREMLNNDSKTWKKRCVNSRVPVAMAFVGLEDPKRKEKEI